MHLYTRFLFNIDRVYFGNYIILQISLIFGIVYHKSNSFIKTFKGITPEKI